MLEGLKHAHSGLRWIVLFLIAFAIISAYSGWKGNKEYTGSHKKIHLFSMIGLHIQVLIGLVLYFLNFGAKVNFSDIGEETGIIRFFTVEHLTAMLIAAVIFTIGYSKAKRLSNDNMKFKTIFIFYTIALVIIFLAIPWPFSIWAKYGGGWG